MEIVIYYLNFSLALFAIADPLALVSIFISITDGFSLRHKKKTIVKACLSMVIVLFMVLFTGDKILYIFGASLNSFKIAGGLLLMSIAFSLMKARVSEMQQTEEEQQEAEAKTSVGVVPLAIPLLAGPGSMSLVIIQSQINTGFQHMIAIMAGILTVALLSFVILHLAEPISRRLGTTGINIFNRILGLIIASVAVELIVSGILGHFPGLAG